MIYRYSVPLVNKLPTLFQYLVCNKVKEGLGLSECQMNFFSGAAPMMLDVKQFFAGLDIPITEVSFFVFMVGFFGFLVFPNIVENNIIVFLN